MNKRFPYPFPERFRSRLMLHYRTNITGTPVPEKLPFRVLVLGQLTCKKDRDLGLLPPLEKRKVWSIKFGTVGSGVDDLMGEVLPWMELPPELAGPQNNLTGELTATLSAKHVEIEKDKTADVEFEVTQGTFISKKSPDGYVELVGRDLGLGTRHTLTLKKDGEKLTVVAKGGGKVKLAIHGRARGVVDKGEPKKPKETVAGLVTGVEVEPANIEVVVDEDDPNQRKLKATFLKPVSTVAKGVLAFSKLSSFAPDEVAWALPTLYERYMVRALLLHLQSLLRNVPAFRTAMKAAFDPKNKDALKNLQTWATASYPLLQIKKPTATGEGAPAKDPPEPPEFDEASEILQKSLLGPVGGAAKALVERKAVAILTPVTPTGVKYWDNDPTFDDGARVMNAIAAFLINLDLLEGDDAKLANLATIESLDGVHTRIAKMAEAIELDVKKKLDGLFHSKEFRELERNWRSIDELAMAVSQEDVVIDFLDVGKEELREDFADNASDLFSSALFRKVYIEEYDRYGGKPFATMIGLFEMLSSEGDVKWLQTMSKIAAAAHCPFVASVGPEFFDKDTMQEVAALGDIDAVLNHPKRGKWNAFRDEDNAAYIGLTLPRYLQRLPWGASGEENAPGNTIGYLEEVRPGVYGDKGEFLWGSAVVPFAKNVIRSYEMSEWAQHIRGPKGGGLCEGLNVFTYIRKDGEVKYGRDALALDGGKEEMLPPIEAVIPDHREYQFSRNGLMALVHRKDQPVATFFSAQSVKKPRTFMEDVNTKNAHLVTNLSYTYSITRIAHYVKAMMREYIGSTADRAYIQRTLESWLGGFVTTVVNPDDLTLLYYPFKATSVVVEDKPGPFGWYNATISILPHQQFEGMDVELRLEAALGGAK